MKSLKQRRLEFLEDTIKYYSEDVSRIAISGGKCRYLTDDGRKCAIGRWIPEDKYSPDIEERNCEEFDLKKYLPHKIYSLGKNFLRRVQLIHDITSYWTPKGLSQEGEDYKKCIISKFELT